MAHTRGQRMVYCDVGVSPLKYEIDDSVTVTVVLPGEARHCTLMGGT